jgi:hypothetical protein
VRREHFGNRNGEGEAGVGGKAKGVLEWERGPRSAEGAKRRCGKEPGTKAGVERTSSRSGAEGDATGALS